MTAKSNAERQEALRKANAKRQAAIRARREAKGLKEYRVWIDPSNTEKVNQIKALDERKGARHETSNCTN